MNTPLQERVHPWLMACFGAEIAGDKKERNHRFLEESIELVQALGCTQSESHQLVDYVFNRPIGEPHQEVGGVMITLAALCLANGLDMDAAGEDELARIWTKVEKIRAKQAAKPKHSPLAEECSVPDYSHQLAEKDAKIAEQAAQIVALREAVEKERDDCFNRACKDYNEEIARLTAKSEKMCQAFVAEAAKKHEELAIIEQAIEMVNTPGTTKYNLPKAINLKIIQRDEFHDATLKKLDAAKTEIQRLKGEYSLLLQTYKKLEATEQKTRDAYDRAMTDCVMLRAENNALTAELAKAARAAKEGEK